MLYVKQTIARKLIPSIDMELTKSEIAIAILDNLQVAFDGQMDKNAEVVLL